MEDFDEPGEEKSSDATDELVENGRWKVERRSEEKVEEAERMLGGKRSSTTG